MSTFSEQVEAQVTEAKKRLDEVARRSAERLITYIQRPGWSARAARRAGNGEDVGIRHDSAVPVDTGFLRASLVVGSVPVQGTTKGAENGHYDWNESQATGYIRSMSLNTTMYATYAAEYAAKIHWGSDGFPARPWVNLSVQMWPTIVAEVVGELAAGG